MHLLKLGAYLRGSPISSYPSILLFNGRHLQIYLYLWICLFWAFHITNHTLAFCVWLLSLNIMSSKVCPHCVSASHHFVAE